MPEQRVFTMYLKYNSIFVARNYKGGGGRKDQYVSKPVIPELLRIRGLTYKTTRRGVILNPNNYKILRSRDA